jgi:molecular chaperone DnaJ/DnaJ family protein A protein 2
MFLFFLLIIDFLGEIIAHKDKCHVCQGNKIVEENKILDVVILPGYSNGKKIKFRGENDQLVRN